MKISSILVDCGPLYCVISTKPLSRCVAMAMAMALRSNTKSHHCEPRPSVRQKAEVYG
jgi:hypothetical protein